MEYFKFSSSFYLSIILILSCCSMGWNQESFFLNYKVEGSDELLSEKVRLEYRIDYDEKRLLGGKGQVVDLQKKEIPVYIGTKEEKVNLRIEFNTDAGLRNKNIRFSCITSGAFGEKDSKETVKIGPDGKGIGFIKIPIEKPGQGQVRLDVIRFIDAPKQQVSIDKNVAITFNVVSLNEEFRKIKTKRRAEDIKGMAKWHDYFDFYYQERFNQIQKIDLAREALTFFKDRLSEEHNFYETKATNESSPWVNTFEYYRVFGKLNYRSVAAFKRTARSFMRRAEEEAWEMAKQNGDPEEIESFLNRFCDDSVGYVCTTTKAVDQEIESLLRQWNANKENRSAYCTFLTKIKESRFYLKKDIKNKYPNAQSYCETVPPDPEAICKAFVRRAKRKGSLTRAKAYLAEAKEANCEAKYLDQIQDIICELEFERARKEKNIDQKKSLLKEVANESKCNEFRKKADGLLNELIPPQLELLTKELIPIKDPEKGNRTYYKYEVRVISGNDVEIFRIDGVENFQDSFPQISIAKTQEEKDQTLFEIRIYDHANPKVGDRLIEFRDKYDQIETTTLAKQVFVLVQGELEDNQLLVEVKHGRPPYWVEFIQEGNSIFHQMRGVKETIDLTAIGKIEGGNFQMKVSDSNGSSILLEKDILIPSIKASANRLWPYLGGPTLLLMAFLFYRNRS